MVSRTVNAKGEMINGASKIIRAELNVPLELVYRDAEPVQGQYGDQMKFTLADGRIFYADLPVANKIEALGIQPGQPFTILKRKEGRSLTWLITPGAAAATAAPARAAIPAPQVNNGPVSSFIQNSRNGHGELVIPAPNGNGCAENGSGHVPVPSVQPEQQRRFQSLIEQTQSLIDAYGALLAYASQRHGSNIKPEDVRSLLTTTFIQQRSGR
jgi:hypothetical protein